MHVRKITARISKGFVGNRSSTTSEPDET